MVGKVMKPVVKGGEEWTMDGWLTGNLDTVLTKAIPNKWDCISVIFGIEGSGKSTLAVQICKYLDPSFCVERVVFTPEDFTKAIENADDEQAILWDEAITGVNIANQATSISKNIVSQLTQIRKKKLKIFLCFPYYNMLNKYFVMRCLFNIYVYAKGFDKRGFFYFYTKTQSEFLYNLMKEKFRNHYKGAINESTHGFKGFFNAQFPIDEKAYDKKKDAGRIGELNSDGTIPKVCGHEWVYRIKNKHWLCKRCGSIVDVNPYDTPDNLKNINNKKESVLLPKKTVGGKKNVKKSK